ncbi:MAG: hypothetical protein C0489_10745, partial [Candidatus Accumulibacter sp.]|nr:hypothetical protein [Accumulibacter sp.]
LEEQAQVLAASLAVFVIDTGNSSYPGHAAPARSARPVALSAPSGRRTLALPAGGDDEWAEF